MRQLDGSIARRSKFTSIYRWPFDPELTVEGPTLRRGSIASPIRHAIANSAAWRRYSSRKGAPKLLKNGPKRGQNLVAALGGLGKLRDIVAVLPID
jgi:hypothetical protein